MRQINVEFVSREEIRAGIKRLRGLLDYAVQNVHPGAIQLEGDTAVGRAYIAEFGRMRDGSSLLNYSVYHDRYLFTEIGEGALREFAALADAARRGQGSAWDWLQRLSEQMLAGVADAPEYPLVILQAFTSDSVPAEARARSGFSLGGQQEAKHACNSGRAGVSSEGR
jgi:hypothetical protein